MPYNLEAEQSILGCILIDMELQFDIVSKLKEIDFYLESHKLIFSAMNDIVGRNMPVDIVTLSDEMEKAATFDKVGGIDYLTMLSKSTPSAANYEYYLNIVKRDSTLRQLIRSADKIVDNAKNSTDHMRSLAFAEKSVFDISEQLDTSSLANIVPEFPKILDKFENIEKDKDFLQGLKTGFTGIDNLTQGFHVGNLIILAARPSVGKTTFAMNIVENVAIRDNAVCAVFALEMTREELAQRMMCSVANVSGQNAVQGKLTNEDWRKLWDSKSILEKTKIFVDDTSSTNCRDITSKCRRLKAREGRLDLVVVDHIQLMNAIKSSDSRQAEITEISRGLKMLAKDLNVPVLALSQLNRQVTARKGKPMLSDLRESGAIEQDADIVMFIHRPDMIADEKDIEAGKVKKGVAEIIFAKNRSGACETVPLLFRGERSKFVNMPSGYVSDSQAPAPKGERPQAMKKIVEENDDDIGEGEDIDEIF